jgi:predicted aspartyl protease
MHTQGARTFYINSTIQNSYRSKMLVDTGSSHSVINQATLKHLQASGDAKFLKNLQAIMADGSKRIVPLYQISNIVLGEGCLLREIEATVLPNNTRQILGISALQKAGPFGFSFNPPTLSLSHCDAIQSIN